MLSFASRTQKMPPRQRLSSTNTLSMESNFTSTTTKSRKSERLSMRSSMIRLTSRTSRSRILATLLISSTNLRSMLYLPRSSLLFSQSSTKCKEVVETTWEDNNTQAKDKVQDNTHLSQWVNNLWQACHSQICNNQWVECQCQEISHLKWEWTNPCQEQCLPKWCHLKWEPQECHQWWAADSNLNKWTTHMLNISKEVSKFCLQLLEVTKITRTKLEKLSLNSLRNSLES